MGKKLSKYEVKRRAKAAAKLGEENELRNLTKRQLKRLTITEVADAIFILLDKDRGELERIRDNSNHNVLTAWFASVIEKGIDSGDMYALDALLNRCIGRVKEKLELTGKDGGPIEEVVYTPEERRREIERMRRLRKNLGDD